MVASATLLLACTLAGSPKLSDEGPALSARLGPYGGKRDTFMVAFIDDPAKQTEEKWRAEYDRLSTPQRVAYCIHQLRTEPCSLHGISRWFPPHRYDEHPEPSARVELVRIGKPAVPALIAALGDTAVTKIYPSRHALKPWLVQDAALHILGMIACRNFNVSAELMKDGTAIHKEFSRKTGGDQAIDMAAILTWWNANRCLDEKDWVRAALKRDDCVFNDAVWNLYARLGPKCHGDLMEAYRRLPPGKSDADIFDETTWRKQIVLLTLALKPTSREKPVFRKALNDEPLSVRLAGARGLLELGDHAGVIRLARELDEFRRAGGPSRLDHDYGDILGLLATSGNRTGRQAVFRCLRGENSRLRGRAVGFVGELKMEAAVRSLPELFDDPFVLSGSYTSHQGDATVIVPPRQICDAAAEAFTKLVPESPRFGGKTDREQEASIKVIAKWYAANKRKLVWNGEMLTPKNAGR